MFGTIAGKEIASKMNGKSYVVLSRIMHHEDISQPRLSIALSIDSLIMLHISVSFGNKMQNRNHNRTFKIRCSKLFRTGTSSRLAMIDRGRARESRSGNQFAGMCRLVFRAAETQYSSGTVSWVAEYAGTPREISMSFRTAVGVAP